MSDSERLEALLMARIPPSQHGQLCPVWRKRGKPGGDKCDCRQVEHAASLAAYLAAAGVRFHAIPMPGDDAERAALDAGTHEPAVDDFGNQYLAPRISATPSLQGATATVDAQGYVTSIEDSDA